MSLELDPQELSFKRPFTREVSQVLRLSNPNSVPVAFKVKTTAPKQYCVRPNAGRIDAGGSVEVQVLLQAMREDPPADQKCKDKFLVQSVVAVDGDQVNGKSSSVFHDIEKTSKDSVQEKKIRVSFLPPDSADRVSTPTKGQVNGAHEEAHEETPPAYTPSAANEQQRSRREPDVAKSSATSAAQTAASNVAAAVPTNQDQLKRQLAEAQSQIEQLKRQLDSGLRQRKAESSDDKSTTAALAQKMEQAPGGVPVQIVAVLCLISFILAWWFF